MIQALIRLTRPYYALPLSCGLIVIVAYVVGGAMQPIAARLAAAVLSLYAVLSAAYILNDVCDLPHDRINAPRRMLPAGAISRRAAVTASVVMFLTGIAMSWFCGVLFCIALSAVAVGLIGYDVFSKRLGVFKPVAAAALTTMLYPLAFALAEAADTPRLNVLYIHPLWLFLTTLGYEMLKDNRDVKGDGLTRRSAIAAHPAFLPTARVILSAASLLTLLPYLLGYCKAVYLVSAIAAIGLIAVSLRLTPDKAIRPIYASVFIITAGSLADLWVYGP